MKKNHVSLLVVYKVYKGALEPDWGPMCYSSSSRPLQVGVHHCSPLFPLQHLGKQKAPHAPILINAINQPSELVVAAENRHPHRWGMVARFIQCTRTRNLLTLPLLFAKITSKAGQVQLIYDTVKSFIQQCTYTSEEDLSILEEIWALQTGRLLQPQLLLSCSQKSRLPQSLGKVFYGAYYRHSACMEYRNPKISCSYNYFFAIRWCEFNDPSSPLLCI